MYDSIIIGCGFAGAVVARELVERKQKKVLIIERRDHIGGNAYDFCEEHGILIHKYGPHIFHTNNKRVYEYLSRFSRFSNYSHEVVSNVYGKYLPVPFNLNSLRFVYGNEKADYLEEKLIREYGQDSRVSILTLMKNEDEEIKGIADYIYENVFYHYTMKQWGKSPKELDKSVLERVPILISYDNRYFQDNYQGMPEEGYTKLFEKLLDHENIKVQLESDAKDALSFKENKVFFNGQEYKGEVIYTGALDELFDCEYGRLPYRSLHFATEYYNTESYQTHGVVNYTVTEDFTRITEYKYLTGQKSKDTVIMKEYPMEYLAKDGQVPYYAINNDKNQNLYEQYVAKVKDINNFYLLGRLAEYKYYNIDAIVLRALELADQLV
jgi:UDP-galactopyranose mutase